MFSKTVARFLETLDTLLLFTGRGIGYEDQDGLINRLRTTWANLDDFAEFQGVRSRNAKGEIMDEHCIAGFGGVSIALERWGDPNDPSVLLIHGLGQSRGVWAQTARNIANAGRHVVAYDLRGHGESGRATDGRYDLTAHVGDLLTVLDTLATRPVVVGASAGGWIAAAAVGETAGRTASGLVLVDAAPWFEEGASARIADLLQTHVTGFNNADEAASAIAALHPQRPEADLARLAARLARGDDGRLHWGWDGAVFDAIDMDDVVARLTAGLPKIILPMLFIRGGASEVVNAEAAARLQALVPDAECAEIADAGHLVVSDRADQFDGLLVEFLERRAPRQPLLYTSGSDARTLRDALGCFATGVTIVATRAPDGSPVGLTANSFTAVSLDPPLILVCIARSAGSLVAIEQASHFSINVLHIGQQPASDRFAKRGEDRFDATPYECWDSDVPILSNTLASFECRRYALHDGGDHVVLIGQVEQARFEPRRDPLLFFRGRYRRLHFQ